MLEPLNIESILTYIDEVVTEYESGAYISQEKLLEAQRVLSSNIYWLTSIYIDYKKKYNAIIYNRPKEENGKRESIASAEARAENQYPEVYACKKILEAAKSVSISINNELQLMKND